jgi:hypothetical protein
MGRASAAMQAIPCRVLPPQATFVLVLLPLIASLRGMSLAELPAYVGRGEHAPTPPWPGGNTQASHPRMMSRRRAPLAFGWARRLRSATSVTCMHLLLPHPARPHCRPPGAGFECLRGLTPSCGSDCTGAPLLPLAYVATNLIFNIAALSLIRTAGNVTMSLVMSALVPITIWAFTVSRGACLLLFGCVCEQGNGPVYVCQYMWGNQQQQQQQ